MYLTCAAENITPVHGCFFFFFFFAESKKKITLVQQVFCYEYLILALLIILTKYLTVCRDLNASNILPLKKYSVSLLLSTSLDDEFWPYFKNLIS